MVGESSPEPNTVATLRKLLDTQLLAVLATHNDGAPYTSLVAFAGVEGTRRLLFSTARSTRKYRNLTADARASMLIDNRNNTPGDFADAAAATAVGVCIELDGDELRAMTRLLVKKHPQLTTFVNSPSCAVMALDVEFYSLVWRFQHVVEIRPE